MYALLLSAFAVPAIAATLPARAVASSCAARMDDQLPSFQPADFSYSGNTRRYYVAAAEEVWDYVPTGYDNLRGVPLNQSNEGMQFVATSTQLGTKYVKGLYRGYTDATFTQKTEQPPWIGLQGPLMRAEVGDMIEILVYNNFTNDSISMHSMGLFYSKMSEGSDYYTTSNSSGQAVQYLGNAIPPGECFVYKWLVPENSSPAQGQASKLWSYHGDINLKQDVATGLLGPVIVYQKGQMQATMANYREFVIYYSATTESNSVLFGESVRRFLPAQAMPNPGPSVHPSVAANESIWRPIIYDEPNSALNTSLAQQFTHLNGYLYANLPGLEMCLNDKVIWHVWSLGNFNDGFHVFHLHGNNVQTASGENMAAMTLGPATMATVNMTAYNPGKWNIICHDGGHFEMGMANDYKVYMPDECPQNLRQRMNVPT